MAELGNRSGTRHLKEIPGRKFVYSHCISTNVFYSQQPIRSLARFLAWRPYWYRMNHVLRELDGVIFLANGGSDSRFDDLQLALKLGATCHVVPNALSPAAVKAINKHPLNLQERDRLIAVGSFQWQKGFDFVLRAYAKSRACNEIHCIFLGKSTATSAKNWIIKRRCWVSAQITFFSIRVFRAMLYKRSTTKLNLFYQDLTRNVSHLRYWMLVQAQHHLLLVTLGVLMECREAWP
jgi:hypothetical protein